LAARDWPRQREEYSPGYRTEVVASFAARTMGIQAAFFTPYLRPGMSLLDCGCGPGSITLGLADFVHPGRVTGVDINPDQIAAGRKAATARGISNVNFEAASLYALPFADGTFDAVLAHAVLQHLSEPHSALLEIRRVLKPAGVVGLRDDDVGSLILAPRLPLMDRVLEVLHGTVRMSGGDPTVGRRYRELLRASGFADIAISTTTECDATPEATTMRGDLAAVLLEQMTWKATDSGLSTAEEMPNLIKAVQNWGRHPDAFDAIIWCEAVGRKA